MTEDNQESPKQAGLAAFWGELKRRKVMRVAITYAVVAWLIIQVAATTFGSFGIPVWAFRFVVLMVILGFPLAVILAWAFELTPDGIKTTKHAREEQGAIPLSETQQKKRNWMAYLVGALIPTLIFGALALFFYFQAKPAQEPDEPLTNNLITQSIDKSIAVLPFTNMSPDAENAYFADGIHETILTTLANLGDLRVVSRTSVMPYRDSNKSIPAIGQELNVAYILEGSVQRIGNDFRLTTQLIQAKADEHLWANNYDGKLEDVFVVQSKLAREISDSLKAVISPEEDARLEKKPTENLDAYDLYLKAHNFARNNPEHIKLLEHAVALDPSFTLAWTRLSAAYSTAYVTGRDRSQARIQQARNAIQTALKLDPENPEVLLDLGYFNYACIREYWMAEYFYRQVEKRQPNKALVFEYLGLVYRRDNRWRESIENFEKAYRLEPISVSSFLAVGYHYLHDWATASRYPNTRALQLAAKDKIFGDFLQEGKKMEIEKSDNLSPLEKIAFAWMFGDAAKVLKLASSENQTLDTQVFSPMLGRGRYLSWQIAVAQFVSGDDAAARESLMAYRDRMKLRLETSREDYRTMQRIALAEALLGHEEASLNWFDRAKALVNEAIDSMDGVDFSIDRAIALAWLGHKDEAVAEFERLIKIPSPLNVHFMRHCLDYWPLRDHPGFQAILDDPVNSQPLDLDKL